MLNIIIRMFHTIHDFPNWQQIKESLYDMAQKQLSAEQIIRKIGQFKNYSCCDRNKHPEFPGKNTFDVLYSKYGAELTNIFQKVAKFVLRKPRFEVPLFYSDQNKQFAFSKQQILYLYCQMVLCLIPKQQFDKQIQVQGRFNFLMDFSYIFKQQQFKTQTIIEYLKQQIDNVQSYNETLVIRRQNQKLSIQDIVQDRKNWPMSKLYFKDDQTGIHQFYGTLKVDFANKYLGGGSLMSGQCQQQLMFASYPELFTSQLLCEAMKPNQCIFMSGFKKYFRNKNYQAIYEGPQTHKYAYNNKGMAKQYITAIDASLFGPLNHFNQYTQKSINRQLLKAYVGFNFNQPGVDTVSTGNWGCGAFGGNVRIKFIIQWLACSLTGKNMIYCPYSQHSYLYNSSLFQKIEKLQIGTVYDKLNEAAADVWNTKGQPDIYKAIELLL